MEILPMTKLSDTQLVILGAAAQRADLSVLPLPDSLKLKGGALTKVMDALRNRGMIRVIGADGGRERVVLTSEGMAALGLESDDDAPTGAPEAATAPDAGRQRCPGGRGPGSDHRGRRRARAGQTQGFPQDKGGQGCAGRRQA
jgi:hypothetical protein